MKRLIAVFGLALALCGSGTAGQEPFSLPLSDAGEAKPIQAMTVQVQQVRLPGGSPFTRIYLTRRGTEELILESSGFTVQTTPTETIITTLGRLVMVGKHTTGGDGPSEVRFAPDGTHGMLGNDFRPIRK
jgi:hypothetical protein